MKKSIKSLNDKIWYRVLKVFYSLFLVLTLLVGIAVILDVNDESLFSYQLSDNAQVLCNGKTLNISLKQKLKEWEVLKFKTHESAKNQIKSSFQLSYKKELARFCDVENSYLKNVIKPQTLEERPADSSLTLEQWQRFQDFMNEKSEEAIKNNTLNHNFKDYEIKLTTKVDYKPALVLFIWLTIFLLSLFVVQFVISRIWYYIYFGTIKPSIK